MSKSDLEELLELKGWTKRHLASRLGLGENIVYRWFSDSKDSHRDPVGAAVVLMRMWLEDARNEQKRLASSAS